VHTQAPSTTLRVLLARRYGKVLRASEPIRGVVAFVSMSGGSPRSRFAQMRRHMRRTDAIWVIIYPGRGIGRRLDRVFAGGQQTDLYHDRVATAHRFGERQRCSISA